ncbi:C-type lectin domain family 17, member A-like isoform X1 [Lissotriton helveticus]
MDQQGVYGNLHPLPELEAKWRRGTESASKEGDIYNNFMKVKTHGSWKQREIRKQSIPVESFEAELSGAPPRLPKTGEGISVIGTRKSATSKIGLDLSSPAVEAAFRTPEGPVVTASTSTRKSGSGRRAILVFGILLGILFLGSITLTSMVLLKNAKLSEELKMITLGLSENRSHVLKDLRDFKKEQETYKTNMDHNLEKLKYKIESICVSCPSGWRWFRKACYYFSSTDHTWESAKEFCLNYGAHLVIVNDQEEQAFLDKNRNNKVHWIGFSDSGNEGKWHWVDGSAPTFTFWNEGEPNNSGGEDCATLRSNGKWNDRSCNSNCHLICKKYWVC